MCGARRRALLDALGGSWGLLGCSWGGLGASAADLEETKTTYKKINDFQSSKWELLPNFCPPQREAKSIKNRIQNESKIKHFLTATKSFFKTVLQPSWVDLGPLRAPETCSRPSGARFLINHMFAKNRAWKPNMATNKTEIDPKMAPQNDSKSIKNLDAKK